MGSATILTPANIVQDDDSRLAAVFPRALMIALDRDLVELFHVDRGKQVADDGIEMFADEFNWGPGAQGVPILSRLRWMAYQRPT